MTSAVNRLRLSEVINNWTDGAGDFLNSGSLSFVLFPSLPAPLPPLLLCHSILDVGGGFQGDSQLVTSRLSFSFRPPLRITETSSFDTSLGTIFMKFDSSKKHLEVPSVWTTWRTFFCVPSLLDRRSRI